MKLSTLLSCIFFSLVPLAAQASPIISIGDGRATSWQDALTAGNIRPVSGVLSDQATNFYSNSISQPPLANGFQRSDVIELAAVNSVNIGGDEFDSLVMTWDPPDPSTNPNELGIAAWEYVYDVDPDFSNATVHFSIGPPVGAPQIWDLSFELVDFSGAVKSWFLSMPQMGWQNFWINAAGGTQGAWFLQGQSPGFDITQVVALQFAGAAFNGVLPFPPPPPGTILPAWDWLPFNHLEVTVLGGEVGGDARVVHFGVPASRWWDDIVFT